MRKSIYGAALALSGAVSTVLSPDARAASQDAAPPPEAQPSTPPPSEAPAPALPPPSTPSPAASVPASASLPSAPGSPASTPAASASPAAASPLPEWLRGVTIGGGVLLWWYQPLDVAGAEPGVSVFNARLLLDGKWGIFGLHFEPRIRDSRLRPFFDGPAWLQEAYASFDLGVAQVRLGKTYQHLGLFWDNSFYGNVQVYDGLKLDPNYGASLEGEVGAKDAAVSLGWWAQYFVIDGGTNVSLAGRDTISDAGGRGHRRNQTIARVEPRVKIGEATLALGASGEYFQAQLPAIGTQDVFRGAGDAKLTVGRFGIWAEYLHQEGRSVSAFPYPGTAATATDPAVPGRSSAKVDYVLAGAELTVGIVTARYNFSLGSYREVAVQERMHVPAIGVTPHPNFTFLGELVIWQRSAPEGTTLVDRSFNLTLNAHL